MIPRYGTEERKYYDSLGSDRLADASKPDWKDAPEWAGYLAHELDGEWLWFEDPPNMTASGRMYGASYQVISEATPGPISIEPRPCKTT